MNERCNNCMWQDTEQCENSKTCSSYYPIIETVSDEDVIELVEDGRKEYSKAWQSYISDNFFKHISIDLRAL